MGRSGRGAVLRSRGAAGQSWGSFGEVHESPGKVGAGKHGGGTAGTVASYRCRRKARAAESHGVLGVRKGVP